MAAPKLERRWTCQDLLDLPDDGVRREIIDEELHEIIGASLSHQTVFVNLVVLLKGLVAAASARLLAAPFDVFMGGADPVEPDLFIVLPGNPGALGQRGFRGAPDQIVEIVSPGNRRHDEVRKRRLYAAAGVREYWLVDPEIQTVEVLQLEGGEYVGRKLADEEAVASALLPELAIRVPEVFAGAEEPAGEE